MALNQRPERVVVAAARAVEILPVLRVHRLESWTGRRPGGWPGGGNIRESGPV